MVTLKARLPEQQHVSNTPVKSTMGVSVVNPTEPKEHFMVGIGDRGLGHYKYAVMLNGELYVECGLDEDKAHRITFALNRDLQPRVAYHGTATIEARDSILKEGFRKGTYFAYRIKDAQTFGGKYIFEVEFSIDGFQGDENDWQFHLRDPLPPEAIKGQFEIL
jgi:hypothetical protein